MATQSTAAIAQPSIGQPAIRKSGSAKAISDAAGDDGRDPAGYGTDVAEEPDAHQIASL